MDIMERYQGCLLGLAVGDAIGTTVEFMDRGSFSPVTDMTVSDALARYMETKSPFAGSVDPFSAGNGSLMRLAPIALFYGQDMDLLLKYAAESSRTTHGAVECIDACPAERLLLSKCGGF